LIFYSKLIIVWRKPKSVSGYNNADQNIEEAFDSGKQRNRNPKVLAREHRNRAGERIRPMAEQKAR